MPQLTSVAFDEVREITRKICREVSGNDIAVVQAALVFAYVIVADACHDIPEELKNDYAMAMISQGLSALPPVIEAVREMEPEQLKLAMMPVQGTS